MSDDELVVRFLSLEEDDDESPGLLELLDDRSRRFFFLSFLSSRCFFFFWSASLSLLPELPSSSLLRDLRFDLLLLELCCFVSFFSDDVFVVSPEAFLSALVMSESQFYSCWFRPRLLRSDPNLVDS